MEIFNKVVVSLDFKAEEEQAKIDHAIAMAKAHGDISFTLLSIVPEVIADPEKTITPAEKQQEVLYMQAFEKLRKIASLFPVPAKVSCVVEAGVPSAEIVKQVLKEQHDLLLISTKKQKTVKNHFLGGTSTELMRQCPCPIWAVKPGAGEEVKMMIGMHFDEKVEDHNDTLNHELLKVAGAVADSSTSEMHLVTVVKDINSELSKQRTTELERLRNDISDPTYEVTPVILEGNPTVKLPEYAAQKSIDLLIMGMLSRSGIKGFFIGNTAEKIIDDMDCSVLVVKPKEFVSQIKI